MYWPKYNMVIESPYGRFIYNSYTNNLMEMDTSLISCIDKIKDGDIIDELSAPYYSFKQKNQSRSYNQYATLKIVYSFDYGKKTSKTPDYEHKNSESAILK